MTLKTNINCALGIIVQCFGFAHLYRLRRTKIDRPPRNLKSQPHSTSRCVPAETSDFYLLPMFIETNRGAAPRFAGNYLHAHLRRCNRIAS
jgi:hypothetical protein